MSYPTKITEEELIILQADKKEIQAILDKLYKVSFDTDWKEWQVYNDLGSCFGEYTPDHIYAFPTKVEAEDCASTLRQWHLNSLHSSYRSPKYHPEIPKSEEPVMNNKGQRCNCEDYPCCGCDPQ